MIPISDKAYLVKVMTKAKGELGRGHWSKMDDIFYERFLTKYQSSIRFLCAQLSVEKKLAVQKSLQKLVLKSLT